MPCEQPQDAGRYGVRGCCVEDLRELQTILELSPDAAAWSPGAIAQTLAAYPDHFLVCMQAHRIAGFIAGRRVDVEGEILNLAVRPESRRKGIGLVLVHSFLNGIRREGALQVFLEVRESNHSALSFYSSLGFRPVGRREDYYHSPLETALVLQLRLDPVLKGTT